MHREARAYLWDIREAADAIRRFTAGLDARAYVDDEIIHSAVERKFEIIGEALGRLAKLDPALAQRIPDIRAIVAFRDLLLHGHAAVEHERVWRIAEACDVFRRTGILTKRQRSTYKKHSRNTLGRARGYRECKAYWQAMSFSLASLVFPFQSLRGACHRLFLAMRARSFSAWSEDGGQAVAFFPGTEHDAAGWLSGSVSHRLPGVPCWRSLPL